MEQSGQTSNQVVSEFLTHRFGETDDGDEMMDGDVALFRQVVEDAARFVPVAFGEITPMIADEDKDFIAAAARLLPDSARIRRCSSRRSRCRPSYRRRHHPYGPAWRIPT